MRLSIPFSYFILAWGTFEHTRRSEFDKFYLRVITFFFFPLFQLLKVIRALSLPIANKSDQLTRDPDHQSQAQSYERRTT